ncbi:MAG: glycosyltransferase involved in cell wall biosynthesis [Cryomorphaceae bacterium]|jgi:glycosyltransferase involved in cell wall biosynthesis
MLIGPISKFSNLIMSGSKRFKDKTIIHTEAATGWGGQEIRTFTECKWLRDQGANIILLAPEKTPIWENFKEEGFELIHVPFKKKTQITDMLHCRRLFKQHRPDVVATHSNIDSKAALLAATLANVPKRIRYRHVSIPVRPNFWNKIIYRKLATDIITTGDCISNPLIQNLGLIPSKVHTISTGINLPESFIDRETARLNLCHELNIPTESHFVGQISVLRRWKGQTDVMEGFDQIAQKFPNLHLVFIGGGHGEEYLPPIAASKKHASKIHFVGHKTDPWPYFRALDINILASTEGEGIPQVGMQSMLSDTPFVGTKIGGIPEIIKHGETGMLFDSASPSQIKDTLTLLLENHQQRINIATNARLWAMDHCLTEQMGEKVLQILEI